MSRKGRLLLASIVAVLGAVVACSKSTGGLEPSPTTTGATNQEAATLKASAPTLVSPIGGAAITTPQLIFTYKASEAAAGVALTYHVQILNSTDAVVGEGTGSGLSTTVNSSLTPNTTFKWRARAEYSGLYGPWSATDTFKSPDKIVGYIRGNEVYDPLVEGTTVGEIHGKVTFIPGQGVRLDEEESYIQYSIPQTMAAGEFSALVSSLSVMSATEDPKLRVLTAREGDAAINDNPYRMSVDKRGNGAVAWRFLTNAESYIETVGQEREVVVFHEALTYLVRASWGNHFFRVQYVEGGVNGNTVYDNGKGYNHEYTPFPFNAFLGSPFKPGDRGEPSSVDGMIVRQVWISPNPRPGFALK